MASYFRCVEQFAIGIDCPDVGYPDPPPPVLETRCETRSFNWEDAEMYVQEGGRVGRDGKLACALLMKNGCDISQRYTSKQMIKYCTNESSCADAQFFIVIFHLVSFFHKVVCASCCECGQCDKILSSFFILIIITSLYQSSSLSSISEFSS